MTPELASLLAELAADVRRATSYVRTHAGLRLDGPERAMLDAAIAKTRAIENSIAAHRPSVVVDIVRRETEKLVGTR